MLYAMCFALFMLGLYCAVVKKNMVKIVLGIVIMEYAVNLFLILLGFRTDAVAPIVDRQFLETGADGMTVTGAFLRQAVDPLPQALVLTSIVISLGTLALMISVCIRIYGKYGTFDITEIRRLKG
ncbi:MAG TPA: cation:proton antiporter [Phycisphaerales bacterium]|nr:cation:proton antiporter [Phycisphaerales bacterium]